MSCESCDCCVFFIYICKNYTRFQAAPWPSGYICKRHVVRNTKVACLKIGQGNVFERPVRNGQMVLRQKSWIQNLAEKINNK